MGGSSSTGAMVNAQHTMEKNEHGRSSGWAMMCSFELEYVYISNETNAFNLFLNYCFQLALLLLSISFREQIHLSMMTLIWLGKTVDNGARGQGDVLFQKDLPIDFAW